MTILILTMMRGQKIIKITTPITLTMVKGMMIQVVKRVSVIALLIMALSLTMQKRPIMEEVEMIRPTSRISVFLAPLSRSQHQPLVTNFPRLETNLSIYVCIYAFSMSISRLRSILISMVVNRSLP